MPGAARLADVSTGDPCGAPPRINIEASGNTFIDGRGAHRKGDAWMPHPCPGSPPHGASTSSGSPNTFTDGKAQARIGDAISCGSSISTGSGNTIVD